MEQENIITSMGRSDDRYSSEFQQLSQELQNSKEEVSDLMRALEDLAVSYEQKAEALGGMHVFIFYFIFMKKACLLDKRAFLTGRVRAGLTRLLSFSSDARG